MDTTTAPATRRQAFRCFQECRPSGVLLWNIDARLDWITGLPERIRTMDDLRLELGCTWGQRQAGCTETPDATMAVEMATIDGSELRTITTPMGILRSRMRLGHPEEHPVKGPEDLPALLHYYSHTDIGLPAPKDIDYASLGPSPVQQLLEYDMGLETFYALLADHPDAMHELLAAMEQVHLERTRAACALPGGGILLGENTSTAMISPAWYRSLSLPGLRRQAELVHQHGKRLRLHMCGHLRGLLPDLAEVGMDGIHSLTPPPIGDVPFALGFRSLPGVSVEGRLNQQSWYRLGEDRIRAVLASLLDPVIWREQPFLLLLSIDGVPTEFSELERLVAILRTLA